MIPETRRRPVCTDQGGFAQISEELMTVFAFMFPDIKTFRHAYLLQLTQDTEDEIIVITLPAYSSPGINTGVSHRRGYS